MYYNKAEPIPMIKAIQGGNSMKITSFHPVIMTTKADEIIAMFEELGFKRKHFTQLSIILKSEKS